MRAATQSPTVTSSSPPGTHNRPSRSRFERGIVVAVVGLAVGLGFGITSYRNSQQMIDTFSRTSVPGTMTVQVDEPGQRVVYYEGGQNVSLGELVVTIIGPVGSTVAVAPYETELIYETTDLTLGRAIASFDAAQIGDYEIEVGGVDSGQVTVGESFARIALPGVLGGLAIAGLSLLAGLALWLFPILRR